MYIHYNNSYNALNATRYSRVGERCAHGETKTLQLNTPKKSLVPFYSNASTRPRTISSDRTDEYGFARKATYALEATYAYEVRRSA